MTAEGSLSVPDRAGPTDVPPVATSALRKLGRSAVAVGTLAVAILVTFWLSLTIRKAISSLPHVGKPNDFQSQLQDLHALEGDAIKLMWYLQSNQMAQQLSRLRSAKNCNRGNIHEGFVAEEKAGLSTRSRGGVQTA